MFTRADRMNSAARLMLKTPRLVREILLAASQKRLNICYPIDHSALEIGRLFARGSCQNVHHQATSCEFFHSTLCSGAGGSIFEGVYHNEDVVVKKMCSTDLCYDPRAFLLEVNCPVLYHCIDCAFQFLTLFSPCHGCFCCIDARVLLLLLVVVLFLFFLLSAL